MISKIHLWYSKGTFLQRVFVNLSKLFETVLRKNIWHGSNFMLTTKKVFIPVRSGSNCILFTDLNMTPQFQKWQYSNCFEKSWLNFWMISKYHHPPHSTQPLVYFQWSAITNAFCSVSCEAYLELFHHCQTYRRLFSVAPDEHKVVFF